MKIITEKTVCYYVTYDDDGNSIYGGPFYTKEEAVQCLKDYKACQKREAFLAVHMRDNKAELL